MLLTGAQVSMAITSGIVLLFTFLLFLSGYILQQQTVRGLQGAIRHHMAQQNEKLPVNFPKSTGVKIIPGPKETFFANPLPQDGTTQEEAKARDEGLTASKEGNGPKSGNEKGGEDAMGHMLTSVEELNEEEGAENESQSHDGPKEGEKDNAVPASVIDAAGERWAVKGRGSSAAMEDRETSLYRRRMAQLMDERKQAEAQKKMGVR
ncbi:MAG: hypothetical protein M1831_002193 [Alyxoria varia]|nr:MAG: hypothetical protein M1831_002193 [Alyxoria varia]